MKPPQSLAGYIRQHLQELEARLEVGVRQEVIVAELEAHGYKTTLKGFRNFLYRARLHSVKKAVAASAKPASPQEKKYAPSVAQKPAHEKQEVPPNPLKRRAGFEFKGTTAVDENDLI